MDDTSVLQQTALHALHQELGGRLVPFVGWELPLQFEGVVSEHRWCRASAALFDVSHMATFDVVRSDKTAQALETLTPTAITSLKLGRSRYGLFTTHDGGVTDDFIIGHTEGTLRVVSNASRRDLVASLLDHVLDSDDYVERTDVALLALQGPSSAGVISSLFPQLDDMRFMDTVRTELDGAPVIVSRSGYTGEDGFEVSIDNGRAEGLARRLLGVEEVRPAGLGSRDSLRLEAGLCLYGNDLDETTTPVEADLAWTIGKRRREAADFPGAKIILDQLENGPQRLRVGIRADGRRPIRDGADLTDQKGNAVGVVRSGGFGPTLDAPVAMGYVATSQAEVGTKLVAHVRGNEVPCVVAPLPFAPHHYFKGKNV